MTKLIVDRIDEIRLLSKCTIGRVVFISQEYESDCFNTNRLKACIGHIEGFHPAASRDTVEVCVRTPEGRRYVEPEFLIFIE